MNPPASAQIRAAAQRLRNAGIDDPLREARKLACHAMDLSTEQLTLQMEAPFPAYAVRVFEDSLQAREARKPMAQIIGRHPFWKHSFRATPDVLVPRPETECLVAAALTRPPARILDLGTGTGAILLSLLAELPNAYGLGIDICANALAVAQQNAHEMRISERVDFQRSNWFSDVEGKFDLLVANPPYIPASQIPTLAPELAYEPRIALTDEGDGLSAYRAIIPRAPAHLSANGQLMVEIGETQGEAVLALFANAGFADLNILPDLDGRDRIVSGFHGAISV